MRRSGFALALAAQLAGAGLAQEGARDGKSGDPVFGTEVNHVEVDAFVLDERGEFLRALDRDDFQVLEEGVPQEITAFAEIAIPIQRPQEALLESLPARDTATNLRTFGGRVWVLLLDEAHTDARRSDSVRKVAGEFVEEEMAADDIAAVVIAGNKPAMGQPFTSDKRLLLEAVARFAGRKPASATLERLNLIEFQRETAASRGREPAETMAPVHGRDLDPWDLERTHNARTSMETLENVARGLGAARGRRKAILYFSEGIDYDTLDVMRRVQRDAPTVEHSIKKAVAIANRHGVAVYPVDPRGLISGLGPDNIQMKAPVDATGAGAGLQPGDADRAAATTPPATRIDSLTLDREVRRSLDSLYLLARETGGLAVVDTNDYRPAYDSIVRANSQYYLLGYYPSDFRRDGRFRRIEVRVRRPGVTVVARDGYVRPRPEDREEGPGTRAASGTSPEVRELLDRPWAQPGLTLGVTAAAFKARPGAASVAVTIQLEGKDLPFREEGERAVNDIEISLLAIDPEGRVRGGDRMLAQPRLRPETLRGVLDHGLRFVRRLELPPGRYQLRVAAREAEQGRRGSVVYDLRVPDYGEESLQMSGVLLTSRRAPQTLTASMDDQVKKLLETPPTVKRTFAADDVITAYAEVYDDPAPARDVTITSRVTSADGLVLFRSSDRRASSEIDRGGRLAHEVRVPLAALKPGEYVLQIEATPSTGKATVTRAVSFDIAPLPSWVPGAEVAGFPPGTGPDRFAPASRIDRLEAWLAAVEQHEPGKADGPARMVRAFSPPELAQLATDLSLLVRLVESPKEPVLWVTDPERPTRFFRAPYSTDDDKRLRAAARDAALGCGRERGPDHSAPAAEALRCARNRILKRGAVLHTDAAILLEDAAAPPGPSQARHSDRWQVRFTDGMQQTAEGADGHWELARSLLENVAPDPKADDAVRLWYIATSAHGQYYQLYTRNEELAVELFPKDPHVLFLAGCLHETFASPTIQSLTRSIHVSGARPGIHSEKAELRTAEELFRRALKAEPALIEARIRRGRVLHQLGQPEEAVRELRQAVVTLLSDEGAKAGPDATLMLYFAEMFFAAAAEELGQGDRARASYARAAELFPGAPSPNLALSQLALRTNDRAAALGAVERALQPAGGDRPREDPWWGYHTIQGRDAAGWFDRLHESLEDEP